MKFNPFRKSIASITKQFNDMVADLNKLAEQCSAEAAATSENATSLSAAAAAKYEAELVKVDALWADVVSLKSEASQATKLAAKIAKTFQL